jgi:hypothetical protein
MGLELVLWNGLRMKYLHLKDKDLVVVVIIIRNNNYNSSIIYPAVLPP